ncbi:MULTISPECIES: hypothetical protein [unclassified Methylobacterium]|uniref:hypothetical protein n=1 Tax=unclassified Methylobacterium TaxID=2615210 RepID=UPI00036F2C4D|nr:MULTISPECIES: hypothetical protein [unclassified Methylobacterium]KQP47154.1 hypothetical protein ASF34_05970 [Methylobacterium sp. Leaf106]
MALAKAMIAMFHASFDGGMPLIALRGSDVITADIQAGVERWFLQWGASTRTAAPPCTWRWISSTR